MLRNVIALNIAAWNCNTKLKLYVFEGNSDISTLKGRGRDYVYIDAKPLDDLLKEIEKVDWIKIDVEGAEFETLKGLEDTLRKKSPRLIVEVFEQNREKCKYMKAMGYEPKTIFSGPNRSYYFLKSGRG